MNIPISLVATLSCALIGGAIKKYFTDTFVDKNLTRHLYNALTSIVASLVLLLWGGFGSASIFTILLAVIFGLVTALQQITNFKALETGPWSYTSVLISLSTLIPALSGALFFNESIGVFQIIGMVLLVACFILSVDFSKSDKKANLTWLIYTLIAFLCTGAIGVMQKVHQTSEFKNELNAFLIIAFAVSFVYSLLFTIVHTKKTLLLADQEKTNAMKIYKVIPFVLMAIAGATVAVCNKLNLYLSGVMNTAVFFPLVNGGGLVLTTICAVTVFKEKLTLRQWIGLVVGTASVILLVL